MAHLRIHLETVHGLSREAVRQMVPTRNYAPPLQGFTRFMQPQAPVAETGESQGHQGFAGDSGVAGEWGGEEQGGAEGASGQATGQDVSGCV